MIRVHRITLDPNDVQATALARSAGTARFTWNWALAEWKRQYAAGEKPNDAALRRQLNAIKRNAYPWMLDVSKSVPQQAVKDLGAAFKRFFRGEARYPRFKKKGKSRDRFRADNGPGTVTVSGRRIKLPKLGWLRLRERPRFTGTIKSAIVSREADRWFVAISVETDDIPTVAYPAPTRDDNPVGVDLGVKALATLSDGTCIIGPKALDTQLKKLQRLSEAHSRKQRGSANRKKSAAKLARLHRRIANIRKDALHKLTTYLVQNHDRIVIEDLNVTGMMANGRLARLIADVGFYEFRRQLTYKAKWAGVEVIVADRWFPSSKQCSACGQKNDALILADRTWTCGGCDTRHDRDLNAARNLRHLAASSAVSACGAYVAEAGTEQQVCSCLSRFA